MHAWRCKVIKWTTLKLGTTMRSILGATLIPIHYFFFPWAIPIHWFINKEPIFKFFSAAAAFWAQGLTLLSRTKSLKTKGEIKKKNFYFFPFSNKPISRVSKLKFQKPKRNPVKRGILTIRAKPIPKERKRQEISGLTGAGSHWLRPCGLSQRASGLSDGVGLYQKWKVVRGRKRGKPQISCYL